MTTHQTTTEETSHHSSEPIPDDIMHEASELSRGAEILPEGKIGLARKLLAARKEGRKLRVKLGIDPTSMDLHIGHAVVLRKLRRFQEFGHQIVLIIGGFTAQIGDPSGRNKTRPTLTRAQVDENAQTYLNQAGLVIDLEKTELTNNADWLAVLSLNDILKLAGSVTVNQLLAKEAFGDRLDKQLPVSFHELFYPLLQGYDSVQIRADVELGGTDQRFNILQGRELQPYYGQEPQLACLLPLLEGTDGEQKMSKTYNNYIGLKEDPKDMFGKCMRIPDSLIIKYFDLATDLSGSEIDAIKQELDAGKNPNEVKKALAARIVLQYHGKAVADNAIADWEKVHSKGELPEDIPNFKITEPKPLFKVLSESGMAESSAQAKRLVTEGGVKVDGEKITDPNYSVEKDGAVIQIGKRKFVRIER